MTEAEWTGSADWYAMLGAVPSADRTRKLRLWGIAIARLILEELPRRGQEWSAFQGAPVEEYLREVNAAETFADGAISRAVLNTLRARVGGPYNVIRFSSALTTLTVENAGSSIRSFSNEFGAPAEEYTTALVRCIFGNPFSPVAFNPAWRTSTAVALARQMYDSRDFGAMPILADALQDAGCEDEQVLTHCREPGPHARGCWVCDAVLGKA